MNLSKEWKRNWNSAYNFFKSKGNVQTKARLKVKWYNEFKDMLSKIGNKTR